jgi:hypothetical protein
MDQREGPSAHVMLSVTRFMFPKNGTPCQLVVITVIRSVAFIREKSFLAYIIFETVGS